MSQYGQTFVPRDYVPITPNNTTELPGFGGLLITGTGAIVVRFQGGSADRTITIASAPFVLHGYIQHVRATGTTVTAANIFGLLQ